MSPKTPTTVDANTVSTYIGEVFTVTSMDDSTTPDAVDAATADGADAIATVSESEKSALEIYAVQAIRVATALTMTSSRAIEREVKSRNIKSEYTANNSITWYGMTGVVISTFTGSLGKIEARNGKAHITREGNVRDVFRLIKTLGAPLTRSTTARLSEGATLIDWYHAMLEAIAVKQEAKITATPPNTPSTDEGDDEGDDEGASDDATPMGNLIDSLTNVSNAVLERKGELTPEHIEALKAIMLNLGEAAGYKVPTQRKGKVSAPVAA